MTVVTAGVSVSLTPSWQGSSKLDAANPTPATRVVLTLNDGVAAYSTNLQETAASGLSRKGVSFNALADMSTAQQASLNANGSGSTDSMGTNRVSSEMFLRVRSGWV